MTVNESQLRSAPVYTLAIEGFDILGLNDTHYEIVLGPWKRSKEAIEFSSFLTDTRIGEQLCIKFGIESIRLVELWT
jgi:hypothetical protein